MKKQAKGILYGVIASSSYGTNPLFALPLYAGGIGVNSVLFYRYAIAVTIYGLWLKFAKKIAVAIERLSKDGIVFWDIHPDNNMIKAIASIYRLAYARGQLGQSFII